LLSFILSSFSQARDASGWYADEPWRPPLQWRLARHPILKLSSAGAATANSTLGALPVHLEGCDTPATTSDRAGETLTHAQCLFLGFGNSGAVVPDDIRNCWASTGGDSPAGSLRSITPAIAIPSHPTPEKLRADLTDELGQIGDGRNNGVGARGASAPQGANSMFVSYTSEDVSDATTGVAGGSWNASAHPAFRAHAEAQGAAAPAQNTSGLCHLDAVVHRGGSGARHAAHAQTVSGNFDSAFQASTSAGSFYGSMWGGNSMWSGGALMDSTPEGTLRDPLGPRGASSHLSEHSVVTGAAWGQLGMPSGALNRMRMVQESTSHFACLLSLGIVLALHERVCSAVRPRAH
jgi:hypothetical protein